MKSNFNCQVKRGLNLIGKRFHVHFDENLSYFNLGVLKKKKKKGRFKSEHSQS